MKTVIGHAGLAQDKINDGTFSQIKWTCKWSTEHHTNVKRKYSAHGWEFVCTTNTMEGWISSSAMMTGGFLSQ